MITIKDIAKQLNIGVSTVSMALNDNPKIKKETKELILAKAKELGYVKNGFASDLQKGKSNLILLIVEDASRPFFAKVINVIQKRVSKYNFDLLIATTFQNHGETAKKYISEHRAAGALIYTQSIDSEFIMQYADANFPVYVFGRYMEDTDYMMSSKVYFKEKDDSTKNISGYVNTKYLIDQGFKKIAYVRTILNTLGTVRRFEGYLLALHDAHILFDETNIFDTENDTFESGYDTTKQMIEKIKKKEIDAIFYANDSIAVGGIHCLLENNIRIPEDISIIGQHDLPESKSVIPQLTTVTEKDFSLQYNYAVDLLVATINGKSISDVKSMYAPLFCNMKEVVIERETVKKKR